MLCSILGVAARLGAPAASFSTLFKFFLPLHVVTSRLLEERVGQVVEARGSVTKSLMPQKQMEKVEK